MEKDTERVYVKVVSLFDTTGYLLPQTIIWRNGKRFAIDSIKEFRPLPDRNTDCYTVLIRGETKLLYFEKTSAMFRSTVGRWWVELPVKEAVSG